MDLNKLTQKSQEAVQEAVTLAARFGHQHADAEHLLAALLGQADGLVPRLLGKMDMAVPPVRDAVDADLSRRPSISGPGAELGKASVTQRLQKVLITAQDEAKRLKDDYVSVEHLFLALVDEKPLGPGA